MKEIICKLLAKQRELSAKTAGRVFEKFCDHLNVDNESRYYIIHVQDKIRVTKIQSEETKIANLYIELAEETIKQFELSLGHIPLNEWFSFEQIDLIKKIIIARNKETK